MNTHTQLIAEIEAFVASREMAESTFGRLAVNDGKFVARIRNGGSMTLTTVDRVRTFINTANQVSASEASA